jgi:hypothetical protein
MCRQMFIEHPGRYAASVARAWVDFWTVPIFWKPEQIGSDTLRSAIEGVWWLQHKLLRLANLTFVLLVVAVLGSLALRRRLRWDIGLTSIAVTVLLSSLIQALADQGASSRYHLPTQSLVLLVLMVAWARWLQWPHGQSGTSPPEVQHQPKRASQRHKAKQGNKLQRCQLIASLLLYGRSSASTLLVNSVEGPDSRS